jgi:cell wall-associated NlpC family hydrolase
LLRKRSRYGARVNYHCAVDVAPARAEPRDDAEQVTQLLRDEPLLIEDRRPGWLLVRTAYDYPAWVREELTAEGAGTIPEARAAEAVDEARAYLGSPYEWGGMTERGIDCSGLVHMSYRRLGRIVPRDAHQQEDAGRKLAARELQPGDLITYGEGDKKVATHISFWLGGDRILHSTARDGTNGVVEEIEPVDLRERRRYLLRL